MQKIIHTQEYVVKLLILWLTLHLTLSEVHAGSQNDYSLQLADQHQTNYTILVSKNSSNIESMAAEELAKYLHNITGRLFPITHKLQEHAIVVGRIANIPLLQKHLDVKKLHNTDTNSFQIKTFKKMLLIGGNSETATLYAVYHFLEQYLGVKWLSPDFTHIPAHTKLIIPPINDIQIPRFNYREIFIQESDHSSYATKNFLNGRLGHRNKILLPGENKVIHLQLLSELLPTKQYKKEHPEFYCGGQLDFTNQLLRKILLENLKNKLLNLQFSGQYYIVLENQDISSFCNSTSNQIISHKYGSPAASYIDFVAETARSIKNDYPNVTLLASAYKWTRKPPKAMNLPENMGIMLSDIELDFSKSIKHNTNKDFLADLEGWSRLSNNIIIWHYITNFSNYLMPYPNIKALKEDIKLFADFSQIKGVFLQGAFNTLGSELAELRIWVLAKLLWNPNQNISDLNREFCEKYYGAASPYILKYITILHQEILKSNTQLGVKTPMNTAYLTPDFLLRADKLFQHALIAVKDTPIFSKHVKKTKLGIDMAILATWSDVDKYIKFTNQSRTAKLTYMQRYNELKKTIKSAKVTYFSEGGKINELLALLAIEPKTTVPPIEVKKLVKNRDWYDFQELSMELCCTKIVFDQEASNGIAATMIGKSTQWGFQLNLNYLPPEGKWKLYARAKIKLTSDENLLKHFKFAFFYGVNGKQIKNGNLLWNYMDEKYHTFEIATLKQGDGNVWIRPPNNESVEQLYIDRFFIIKE